MTHPTQFELLQFATDARPEAQPSDIAAHVAVCAACRALVADYEQVHDVLGAWDAATPATDVLPDVLRRLTERPAQARWLRVYRVARVAAALVAGVATGVGAAEFARTGGQTQHPAPMTATEAWSTLGFDELATTSATGLPATLADLETNDGEGNLP